MQSLIDIAFVMLAAGCLGGLVNFYIADPEQEKRLPWWQHIIVGVAAAFMVPLFLNMISGDLIDKIRGVDGKASDYSKMFVLAGFCLVAAVSSRAFIRTLSDKVLQEVRSAKQKAEQAADQAETAAEQATAATVDASVARQAVAHFVEDDDQESPNEASRSGTSATGVIQELSDSEKAVLRALQTSNFALRSMTGIASDAGLSTASTSEVISSLLSKELIGETLGKSGQPRWFLTKAGRITRNDG
jgi:hypothetical protein